MNNAYRIKKQDEINKKEWDAFVNASSMGWAWHLYDLVAFYALKSYSNESFAIVDTKNKGEILLIMQMHRRGTHALSRWGMVIKDSLSRKQRNSLRKSFSDYIDHYLEQHRIRNLEVTLPPLSACFLPEKHNLICPWIFWGFAPEIRYTYVVDLHKPVEKLLADCEETTRQAIRKHEKQEKYKIIEYKSTIPYSEAYETYMRLHKATYTRTGATDHILDEYFVKNIFEKLIPNNISKVYFLYDNELKETVAFVNTLIYKNTAYYWWGGSDSNKVDIGANRYLLFNVIKKTQEYFHHDGYFETGSAFPYLRGDKMKGISDYKRAFGTFLHPIFMGKYIIAPRKPKYLYLKYIKYCFFASLFPNKKNGKYKKQKEYYKSWINQIRLSRGN